MQNRYSGDIGDYSKYSLLRSLFSTPKYRIGLVWYLYPDENHNGDGRHIDYLTQSQYKQCDQQLVKQLSHVVTNQRSVASLERAQILPENTVYFSQCLDFHSRYPGSTIQDRELRTLARENWLDRALKVLLNCNVVVLDPDNGLQIKSVPYLHQKKSGKYAYYSEVEQFFKHRSICIIYHHFDRSASHETQLQIMAKKLKDTIRFDGSVFALRFFPYSPRAYFLLVAQDEVMFVRNRLKVFLDSECGFGWNGLIEL